MGQLFFAVNDGSVHRSESRRLEHIDQLSWKTRAILCIHFPGLLEAMLHEVHHHHTAAGLENAISLCDGFGRVQGMMKTLM